MGNVAIFNNSANLLFHKSVTDIISDALSKPNKHITATTLISETPIVVNIPKEDDVVLVVLKMLLEIVVELVVIVNDDSMTCSPIWFFL